MAISKYPGIPHPTTENILAVVAKLKEAAEIGQRARGVEGDSFVRLEEFNRLQPTLNYLTGRVQNGWDDLRFPVQSINPPGQASDPGVENTTGMFLFSGTGTELVFGVAQLPHSWLEESPIKPHVHWSKTTSAAGNVLWQLDYEVVANGAVAAMNYPSQLQVSTPVTGTPDNDTANEILISSFGDLSMAGSKISCLILWKLSRIGGTDSYNSDARLFEMDFHYQTDSFGSGPEYQK